MNCAPENIQAIQIVQTVSRNLFARLFYSRTLEPFDLTGATEIVALFPGADDTPIEKTLSGSGGITVIGSPGAGKIQIALSSTDTGNMQANPQIGQNLQITATIAGVAQIDTLSFGSPPVVNTTYSVALNGSVFSYKAKTGDTAFTVFTALSTQVAQSGLTISAVVSGSLDSATLALTSTIAGLGFTDMVSAGITLTHSTPNGGTRTIFLLQQVLSIQPQDYDGS